MKNYSEFHDGFLDGVLIPAERSLHVYLRTASGKKTQVLLTGVVAVNLSGFREGNIILDVLVRQGSEIRAQDIGSVHQLEPDRDPKPWDAALLRRAHDSGMILFEINPSYGATCMVLAEKAEFHDLQ